MTETSKAQPTHTFKRGQHGDAFCMVKHAGFICGQAADAPVHAVPAKMGLESPAPTLLRRETPLRNLISRTPRTPPDAAPEAATKRDVLRDLYSLRNRALTSTGWLHREEQLRLLDSIEAWVRAQP